MLQNLELPILDMPSIDEITKGKTKIDALRPIPIEELLGRDVIEAQSDLMKLAIQNKTILITGGAGFIGSHICKLFYDKGFIPVTFDNLSSAILTYSSCISQPTNLRSKFLAETAVVPLPINGSRTMSCL